METVKLFSRVTFVVYGKRFYIITLHDVIMIISACIIIMCGGLFMYYICQIIRGGKFLQFITKA